MQGFPNTFCLWFLQKWKLCHFCVLKSMAHIVSYHFNSLCKASTKQQELLLTFSLNKSSLIWIYSMLHLINVIDFDDWEKIVLYSKYLVGLCHGLTWSSLSLKGTLKRVTPLQARVGKGQQGNCECNSLTLLIGPAAWTFGDSITNSTYYHWKILKNQANYLYLGD